jgi:hypothetical protein
MQALKPESIYIKLKISLLDLLSQTAGLSFA